MVRIYLITDRHVIRDPAGAVASALSVLPIGTAAVQLREKDLPRDELLRLARTLLPLCRSAKAPLLVNTDIEVVQAVRADGVHLPAGGISVAQARRALGPGALIGQSCHTRAEVAQAKEDGADFAVFGPVWDTEEKKGQGMTALHLAAKAAPIPVFAVGGVTPPRAKRALAAGAHGVACIRSVLGAPDPASAALEMWRAVSKS
ncbi:MAG TPA: thiamine phosphate synthase [Myxococcales bacterium]|nr:thiamine phosphate synthase [Myxococcales bacterium]